jgi:hypothetical protein
LNINIKKFCGSHSGRASYPGPCLLSTWHIDPLSDVVQYPPLLDGYLQFALNISHAFATLFQGVVYALISRGVSLGLKMLVETDMNYKLSREEETHAQ